MMKVLDSVSLLCVWWSLQGRPGGKNMEGERESVELPRIKD